MRLIWSARGIPAGVVQWLAADQICNSLSGRPWRTFNLIDEDPLHYPAASLRIPVFRATKNN